MGAALSEKSPGVRTHVQCSELGMLPMQIFIVGRVYRHGETTNLSFLGTT